ncbi:MAG: tetraacyldisaccharide 4'-kinase [Nitrospirae bacterium]|nr:MAG: tetraacyldisaccharide 4'-kinase [Nitrospirota bacterium]
MLHRDLNMLSPLELIYYIGYRIDRKTKTALQKRLQGYTISVGNLTLGGTGKTPMVMAIASEAVKRGFSTCILTRGYKGKAKSLIVSCGRGPEADWKETGDEPFLMAKKLKDVWIVKDSNRYRGGLLAGKKDLFILDDGFQHWALHRNLDIVLIDGTNPFGNGKLLPFGPLREPPEALKRASIIVITKVQEPDETLLRKINAANPEVEVYTAQMTATGFKDLKGHELSLSDLQSRKAFLFSGIGNPASFHKSIEAIGVNIVGTKAFRDHHAYTKEQVRQLIKKGRQLKAEVFITTEKDLIKLETMPEDVLPEELYALVVNMEIKDRDRFFDRLFRDINPKTP